MKRTFASIATAMAIACGTSPTAPPPTAAVILSIDLGALGAAGFVSYGGGLTFTETSGKLGITIPVGSPVTCTLDDGATFTAFMSGQITALHIAAGQAGFARISFADRSGRPPSPRVSVSVGFIDDNGHVGTLTASQEIILPPVVFTIAGVVSDGTSGDALPNVLVRLPIAPIGAGVKSATTDGNGYYSMAGVSAGYVALSVSAANYVTTTQSLILSGVTRLDFVLPRAAGGPPPPPAPFPTGTCPIASYPPRTTAVCVDGTLSESQTRAGACLANQSVACWTCPGVLCH